MRGSISPLFTPWLDHGVHKNNKNTNNVSIFNWIPWSSHGVNRGEIDPRNNAYSQ
ncbi:proline/betaine transporter [Rickettsia parkeri]|uniref:proline/betaine transporter n=1 Tax=Rickettsia parkeri TaxID=35792 RepID=UPI0002DE5E82|nr:proline/betaine transporter [Rickettsia parkeri]